MGEWMDSYLEGKDREPDYPIRYRTPEPEPEPKNGAPPTYVALDLWMALGLDSEDFNAYFEKHGWSNSWAAMLSAVRVYVAAAKP